MDKFFLCTSWDDGDPYNMKMASLLDKFNLKGTFFIPTQSIDDGGLTKQNIKDLAVHHEIGSHTITHSSLRSLDATSASKEISVSKRALEDIIGKEVESFCYPYGNYNEVVVDLVRRFGYKCARTSGRSNISDVSNVYLVSPTALFPRKFVSALTLEIVKASPFTFLTDYSKGEVSVFRRAVKRGQFFHLWGHSWDVERRQRWKQLEELLSELRANFDFEPLTFGELVARASLASGRQRLDSHED